MVEVKVREIKENYVSNKSFSLPNIILRVQNKDIRNITIEYCCIMSECHFIFLFIKINVWIAARVR